METKFLSDGRKVAVLGKLNSEEFIVQEIFVKGDGVEIPSGENFTAKSLHDEPVESYVSKNKRSLEKQVKNIKKDIEKLDNDRRLIQEKLKGNRKILEQSNKLVKCFEDEGKFKTFCGVASGDIKWTVTTDYGVHRGTVLVILPFDESLFYWENSWGKRVFEGIRLVSLMGRSNGDTEYWLNQYSDGSGHGCRTNVQFFDDKEKALEFITEEVKEKIKSNSLNCGALEHYLELGVKLSPDEIKAVYSYALEKNKKKVAEIAHKNETQLAELEEEIKILTEKVK